MSATTPAEPSRRLLVRPMDIFLITLFISAIVAMWWHAHKTRAEKNAAEFTAYMAYSKDTFADDERMDAALTSAVQKKVFKGYKECLGLSGTSTRAFPYDKDFLCLPAAVDRVTKVEPAQAKAFEDALDFYRMQYETTLAKHPGL